MIQRELINPLLAIAALSALVLISQAHAQDNSWPPMERPLSVTIASHSGTQTDLRRPAQRRGLFQLFSRQPRQQAEPNRLQRVRPALQPQRAQLRAAPRRQAQPVRRSIDPRYLPTVVSYPTSEAPGTIIIDTSSRYLYYVQGDGTARRYGVGVGRQGFGWKGTVNVARKAQWPGWTPPAAMRKRQPELPAYMEGGPNNPLGARALYLHRNGRDTLYRIHGSNEPWTIGRAVSSGCIRMRNEDVTELYERVGIGTRVVVL